MNDELLKALATDLGITTLPVEKQKDLVEKFGRVAMRAATISVMEKIPEGKRDEFAALMEANNVDGAKAFLDREVPGHEEVARAAVAQEVEAFKAALAA